MTLTQIFTIIFPIFAIIGLGVLAKRSGLLKDAHATDTLSAYVYYFALPALLLRLVARTPIADYADLNFILAYSLPMIVLATIIGVATRKVGGGIRGMCILTTIFGNVAYMGIPFNTLAFGTVSQPITALTIALTLSLTTFWSLFLGQGALYAAQMKAVTL
ncbi:AEC family transporter, partial [Candidatus Uhrbacteria bacterium]|nr:AEC family transporter [Candidatus Uhrbacteria bacterium]